MHIEKWIGKLWSEGEQTADLHAHLSEVWFGWSVSYFKWKSKTFCKKTNKWKKNPKIPTSFYTLYHPASDAVIRLEPLLSYNPYSKPLSFIFLHFPLENRHVLLLGTWSLAQHPVNLDWIKKEACLPKSWEMEEEVSTVLESEDTLSFCILICVKKHQLWEKWVSEKIKEMSSY